MQTTPVFKDATPREVRTMQFWIGSNIAVILFCASWLIYYFTVAGLSLPYLMAALLVGYFLADFSSGAVHWAMDTWFDERTMGRAIAITREHHTHPDHVYGFLENASFGSAPSAVVFGLAAIVPPPPAALAGSMRTGLRPPESTEDHARELAFPESTCSQK